MRRLSSSTAMPSSALASPLNWSSLTSRRTRTTMIPTPMIWQAHLCLRLVEGDPHAPMFRG